MKAQKWKLNHLTVELIGKAPGVKDLTYKVHAKLTIDFVNNTIKPNFIDSIKIVPLDKKGNTTVIGKSMISKNKIMPFTEKKIEFTYTLRIVEQLIELQIVENLSLEHFL